MNPGGEVQFTDEIYREVILDHYRSPRHSGEMADPDVFEAGINPLCGDELMVFLKFKGVAIAEIAFKGKGCSISQASASMMTEAVQDLDVFRAEALAREFKDMMLEGRPAESLSAELEDAKSLEGVKRYPVRVKCAVLAWNTLLEALKKRGKI